MKRVLWLCGVEAYAEGTIDRPIGPMTENTLMNKMKEQIKSIWEVTDLGDPAKIIGLSGNVQNEPRYWRVQVILIQTLARLEEANRPGSRQSKPLGEMEFIKPKDGRC